MSDELKLERKLADLSVELEMKLHKYLPAKYQGLITEHTKQVASLCAQYQRKPEHGIRKEKRDV